MASDALIGVLSGLSRAYGTHQRNIFDMEQEKREKMAQAYEKVAEHPNITTEGAEQYFRRAFEIRTLPAEKKMPKEWESFISEIAPKFGQSWLGGQTSRKVEAQPMPIGADLEGGTSLKQIEGGAVPGLQDKVQATRTPEPSQYQVPMPEPPPGTQRSAFYSPQEMSQQKIAEAVQMLQALGPIQQQQKLELMQAEQAMQPEEFFPFGAEQGIAERGSGRVIREPELKPVKPPDLSFQEASYEDFKKRPDLTKQYGADRMGYQAWRDAVELERQKAGAQNRFDIQDPARNFSQERQLAAQLLSETDMDRQRLQSYQNLQSVGNDLTGANQIVVLYNFIRLMDPNRVSEGELAIAQRAQTVPEAWKATVGRFIGSPNIFSPEGAARLRAAADAMGKGIQKRVASISQRYKNIAESGGLNPENVVRGIPELLDSTQKQPPAVGFEQDGWIFQGGDPSAPSSWRKK